MIPPATRNMSRSGARIPYRIPLEGVVTEWGEGGCGVIQQDGIAVSIQGALLGEHVTYDVIQQRRRRANGRLLSVASGSPWRTQSACDHYPTCGGCRFQGVSTAEQATLKQAWLAQHIQSINPTWATLMRPMIEAPTLRHYRNKMEFSFGLGPDGVVLGLKARGDFKRVWPVPQCQLTVPFWQDLHQLVMIWVSQWGLSAYDPVSHEGVLRYLMIRHSQHTGAAIVVVVVASPITDAMGALATMLMGRWGIQGVGMAIQATWSDSAFSDQVTVMAGSLTLQDAVGDTLYEIEPYSFFQTNATQVTALHGVIEALVDPQSDWGILDLYCGGGGIGLALAKKVAWVVGIESNPYAIQSAHRNAQLNQVGNLTIIEGTVRRVLKEMERDPLRPDVVIADPPRSGMEPKSILRMVALRPKRVVMVSCQPKTLAHDLGQLMGLGYQPDVIQGVDMFPNTPHMEVVVRLRPIDIL